MVPIWKYEIYPAAERHFSEVQYFQSKTVMKIIGLIFFSRLPYFKYNITYTGVIE